MTRIILLQVETEMPNDELEQYVIGVCDRNQQQDDRAKEIAVISVSVTGIFGD